MGDSYLIAGASDVLTAPGFMFAGPLGAILVGRDAADRFYGQLDIWNDSIRAKPSIVWFDRRGYRQV